MYKVVLTLRSVVVSLKPHHFNESYWLSSAFMWYCLFFNAWLNDFFSNIWPRELRKWKTLRSLNLRVQSHLRLSFVFPQRNATAGNRSMVPGRFYQEAFSFWKFRSGLKKAWARTTKVFKNFCRKQSYLNSDKKMRCMQPICNRQDK